MQSRATSNEQRTTSGRILSGVQPTGNLHLGNYLGAIRNWVRLQGEYECIYMIADLHAITVPQNPEELCKATRETAAAFIACGIDTKKSAVFPQSAVSGHAELSWILGCHTPLGWLNRMTQFKEKINAAKVDSLQQRNKITTLLRKVLGGMKDGDKVNENFLLEVTDLIEVAAKEEELKVSKADLGLYSYPVLMAADVLLYKATHVPVGEDQKQHLELARDIAGAFNRYYGKEFFPLPEPLILGQAARVMSLRDGTKKMSKSDESDYSRINLTDDADAIAKKIKKATSDSYSTIGENIDSRPEALNLLTLYASLKDMTKEQALAECGDKNFSNFKQMLTDVAVAHLSPIAARMRDLLSHADHLDKILAEGTTHARSIADVTMREVKELVGFL